MRSLATFLLGLAAGIALALQLAVTGLAALVVIAALVLLVGAIAWGVGR